MKDLTADRNMCFYRENSMGRVGQFFLLGRAGGEVCVILRSHKAELLPMSVFYLVIR